MAVGERLLGSWAALLVLGTPARPHLLSPAIPRRQPRICRLLHSAVGSDPDNADDVFSNGDIITFTFDMPTYIPSRAHLASDLPTPLITESGGVNLDPFALLLMVRSPSPPCPNANLSHSHRAQLVSSSLSRRYIGHQGSALVADPYRPSDQQGGGRRYDIDAIHRCASPSLIPSPRAHTPTLPTSPGPGLLYSLFGLDYYLTNEAASRVPSFGRGYEGRWTDTSTFVMTITDASRRIGLDERNRVWQRMPRITDASYMGTGYPPAYMERDSIWVRVLGDVRSLGRQSPRCIDRVPLTGNFGNRQQMPQLVSFHATDPDNSDRVPSLGDTVTIIFDRRTSKGRTARPPPPESGTKAYAGHHLPRRAPVGISHLLSGAAHPLF